MKANIAGNTTSDCLLPNQSMQVPYRLNSRVRRLSNPSNLHGVVSTNPTVKGRQGTNRNAPFTKSKVNLGGSSVQSKKSLILLWLLATFTKIFNVCVNPGAFYVCGTADSDVDRFDRRNKTTCKEHRTSSPYSTTILDTQRGLHCHHQMI